MKKVYRDFWYLILMILATYWWTDQWAFHLPTGLMFIGLRAMLFHSNLYKKLIGLNVLSLGIILFYITLGYITGSSVPVYVESINTYVNPLTIALMLTAVVVSAVQTLVGMAFINIIKSLYGTIEEPELLEALKRDKGEKDRFYRTTAAKADNWIHGSAVMAAAVMFIWAVRQAYEVLENGEFSYQLGGWAAPLGIEWLFSHLSVYMLVFVTGVSLVTLIAVRDLVAKELGNLQKEFYIVAIFLIISLCGLCASNDLFNVYVWLELSGLSAYILLGAGRRKAPVAAFRYLIIGTVGASLYLLGVAYYYALFGTLSFDIPEGAVFDPSNPALRASLFLMVIGLGLKMGLFSLHQWMPDVYQYASSPASSLIAPQMAKLPIYLMARIMLDVYGRDYVVNHTPIAQALLALGLGGMVYGAFKAMPQKDMKRTFAYSSVSQLNLIVAALAAGVLFDSKMAIAGAFIHMIVHGIPKGTLFLVAGEAWNRLGTTKIEEVAGMCRDSKVLTMVTALCCTSMIGLPFTGGFIGKMNIGEGILKTGAQNINLGVMIVVLIIFSSVLSIVYFGRLMNKLYFKKEVEQGDMQTDLGEFRSVNLRTVITVMAVMVALLFWIGNSLILRSVILPGLQ